MGEYFKNAHANKVAMVRLVVNHHFVSAGVVKNSFFPGVIPVLLHILFNSIVEILASIFSQPENFIHNLGSPQASFILQHKRNGATCAADGKI